MRYFPQRARSKQDISFLFKVCPTCLGDLVSRSGVSGVYFLCMQCNEVVQPAAKAGVLPAAKVATPPGEFFPEPEPSLT